METFIHNKGVQIMLRIILPCYLVKEQLEAKLALLRQIAEGQFLEWLPAENQKFAIGLEIGTNMQSFLKPDFFDRGKRLLEAADLPKDLFLSFHGPQIMDRPKHPDNFFSCSGFANLLRAVNFANAIGASLVNVHAHQAYSCAMLKGVKPETLTRIKQAHIRIACNSLRELRNQFGPTPTVCIENVPHNLHGDRLVDPEKCLYDLAFVDPADLQEIISPEQNTFACIDVCHLAQVFDSSELLEKIKPLGIGIRHVHLSDVSGAWHPFVSICREGRIPGTGRIGKRVFEELLSHFLALSEQVDINLVLEINDSDWVAINETKQGLAELLTMLWSVRIDQRIRNL